MNCHILQSVPVNSLFPQLDTPMENNSTQINHPSYLLSSRVYENILPLLSHHNRIQKCYMKIKGVTIRSKYFGPVLLGNMLSIATLIIVTSFTGFIDDFRENHVQSVSLKIINVVTMSLMSLNFVVHCIRKTFVEGEVKERIVEIVKVYAISVRLFIDLLVIIFNILFLILSSNQTFARIFFVYLIIVYFFSLNDLHWLQNQYFKRQIWKKLSQLLEIITKSCFFAHTIAVILLSISELSRFDGWVQNDSNHYFFIYSKAYYWATTLMLGVGFGDLAATNWQQSFAIGFVEIFSCLFVAYRLDQLILFIRDIDTSFDTYFRKVQLFNMVLVRREKFLGVFISNKLKDIIINRLQTNQMDKKRHKYHYLDNLLVKLDPSLRKQFYSEIISESFPDILFLQTLRPITLKKIAQHLTSHFLQPTQNMNAIGHDIVLIDEGIVGYFCKKRGSELNGQVQDVLVVKESDKAMLLNTHFLNPSKNLNYDIQSITSVFLWQIELHVFQQLLKESNQMDFEYYFSIVDRHGYTKHTWETIKCKRCVNQYHLSFECPLLLYLPIKGIVLNRFLNKKGKQQPRRTNFHRYRRPRSTKTQTLVNKIENIRSQYSCTDLQELYRQKQDVYNQEVENFRIKYLLQQVLTYYDKRYHGEHWIIESDAAQNYYRYFPKQNSSTYLLSPVSGLMKRSLKRMIKIYKNKYNSLSIIKK